MQPVLRAVDDAFLLELRQFAQSLMAEHGVPGVSLGLLTPEGPRTLNLGVTSAENPLPVTDETLFQIGSITKTFTATLAMRLVEQGRLALDAPLRSYLPDLKLADEDVAVRVTLRHLLTHSGGWRGESLDMYGDTEEGAEALARMVARLPDYPQDAPLGAYFAYSNMGFILLGRVIEVVTGLEYQQAMQQHLLEPLGLTHSLFRPSEIMTRRFAVGHVEGQVGRDWRDILPRAANPAGGLACSVTDVLKYAEFHLGDGQNLMQRGTLQAMQTPQLPSDFAESLRLSWFIAQWDDLICLTHEGATAAQTAQLWMIPALGVAFTALTNAREGFSVYEGVTEWLREHWLGRPVTAPVFIQKTPAELAEYVGQFQQPVSDDPISVRLDGADLAVHVEQSNQSDADTFRGYLNFFEADWARFVDGPYDFTPITFLRDESGEVVYFRFMSRLFGKR